MNTIQLTDEQMNVLMSTLIFATTQMDNMRYTDSAIAVRKLRTEIKNQI